MMQHVNLSCRTLGGRYTITIEDVFVSILKDDKTYSTYLLKEQGLTKSGYLRGD
jgi:hypothetical protein